ncbi:MAG: hypothetical protein O7C56_07155, partial [Rickettsia endosymbiont of Ixodes persulcatus]|nr:hypothetical protein [Rickettsia endosymbiont of Ixodes persulcatus]
LPSSRRSPSNYSVRREVAGIDVQRRHTHTHTRAHTRTHKNLLQAFSAVGIHPHNVPLAV